MRKIVFIFFIVFCIPSCSLHKAANLESGYSHNEEENSRTTTDVYTLPNGLRVILFNTHEGEKASILMRVNRGFMHEASSSPQRGLVHLLEHMITKGSRLNPHIDSFENAITQHGGKYKAFTWLDNTNYAITVPTKEIHEILKHHADIFTSPTFNEERIAKEVKAVIEEGRERISNDFIRLFEDQFLVTKHPVLSNYFFGTEEELSLYKREDLFDFFREQYDAQNMVLVVAGNLDTVFPELKDTIKNHYGNIPHAKQQNVKPYSIFPPWTSEFKLLTLEASNNNKWILITLPTPNYEDPLYFAHMVVFRFINTERKTSLKSYLRERNLIDDIQFRSDSLGTHATFSIFIDHSSKRNAYETIVKAVFDYFREIETYRFSQEWLEEQLIETSINENLNQSNIVEYSETLAFRILKFGVAFSKDYFNNYRRVSLVHLKKVLQECYIPQRMLLSVTLHHVGKGEKHPVTGRIIGLEVNNKLFAALVSKQRRAALTSRSLPRNLFLKNVRFQPLSEENKDPIAKKQKNISIVSRENHDKTQLSTILTIKLNTKLNALEKISLILYLKSFLLHDKDLLEDIRLSGRQVSFDYAGEINAVQVEINGLSFEQGMILSTLVNHLMNSHLEEKYISRALEHEINTYKSFETNYAFLKAQGNLISLINHDGLLPKDTLVLLRNIRPAMIRNAQKVLREKVELYFAQYGDLSREETSNLINNLTNLFNEEVPASLLSANSYPKLTETFKGSLILPTNGNRSAYARYYSGSAYNSNLDDLSKIRETLAFILLAEYLKKLCFDVVRTESGLSYSVGAFTNRLFDPGIRSFPIIFFASTESAESGYVKLKNRFDSLLSTKIDPIKEEDFIAIKNHLIKTVTSNPGSYRERARRLMYEYFTMGSLDFTNKIIPLLQSIRQDDVIKVFNKYIYKQPYVEHGMLGLGDTIPKDTQLIFSQEDLNN